MKIKDIKQHITNPNPLMIDIGAYDGRDSLDFLDEFPGGRAIAIEPLSYKLIPDHPRLDVLPVAVTKDWDGNGNVCDFTLMEVCTSHPQSSSFDSFGPDHERIWPEYKMDAKKIVTAVHGDHIFNAFELNVDVIDLMWIDVNGFEFAVIKSLPKTLPRVKVLKIEVSEKELYDGQSDPHYIIQLIRQSGNFEIADVEHCGPDKAFQNVLLVNRDLV